MNAQLTEDQRFPLMTEAGRQMLRRLQEHPQAPRFNFPCGDRLSAAGLQSVRDYQARLFAAAPQWRHGEVPQWLKQFAARCLADVPFYRRRGGDAAEFFALPATRRSDLSREPWAFVPDAQPLDDLIVYTTSGTTGRPVEVLCHPDVASMCLPLLRRALARHGVALEGGADRVAIVLVCAQNKTFTYATISSFLDEAGFVKINLNPADWRDPNDRVRFLDDCDPQIYTGDPLSFVELAKLPLQTRPKALVSCALALLPGLKRDLETHFGCPVIDLYSMNESGPISVAVDDGHEILPHDLYVEILRPDGSACAPGERGEIVLSGGRNPFLPLLRYRTGDWASLNFDGPAPILIDFEGRAPVVFRGAAGQDINNIDVTVALRPFALAQFALHQNLDGSLLFKARGAHVSHDALRQALRGVFGVGQEIVIEELPEAPDGGKLVPFSSG